MTELVQQLLVDDADEELGWQERALCAQTDPESFFPVLLAKANADSLSSEISRRTARLMRTRVLRRHAFSAAGGAMAWKADLACVAAALSSKSSSSSSSSYISGLDAAAPLLMVPAEALAGLLGSGVGGALLTGKGGGGGASAAASAAAAAAAAQAAANSSSSSSSARNNNVLGAPWRDVADTLQARADVRGGVGVGGGGGV